MAALTANERGALLERRKREYTGDPDACPDFAPDDGYCGGAVRGWDRRWRACNYDLVTHYGDAYPTKRLTGCPRCSRSYCD